MNIYEHISIKGNKTSLLWICKYLMNRNIAFTYDWMTKRISFVQECPEDRTCGELSDLQHIIEECPHKGWDVMNQFQCSYCDILCSR